MQNKLTASGRTRLVTIILIAAAAAGVILLAGAAGRRSSGAIRLPDREKQVEFIASLGWQADPDSAAERSIRLPEQFPEVLKQYNEMQRGQGFDLEQFAGKEITMVTYDLLDYPGEQNVQCVLYLYKGRLIGGDVHSPAFTGFMKPLR